MFTIYGIFCKNEKINDCYIGSTDNFKIRIKNHINTYNCKKSIGYNLKVYEFIRNNGGINNWEFKKLNEINTNREEIVKIEQIYIDSYFSTLNCRNSYTSKEERIENIKKYNASEISKESKKKYKENNSAKISEDWKKYIKTEDGIKSRRKMNNNRNEKRRNMTKYNKVMKQLIKLSMIINEH